MRPYCISRSRIRQRPDCRRPSAKPFGAEKDCRSRKASAVPRAPWADLGGGAARVTYADMLKINRNIFSSRTKGLLCPKSVPHAVGRVIHGQWAFAALSKACAAKRDIWAHVWAHWKKSTTGWRLQARDWQPTASSARASDPFVSRNTHTHSTGPETCPPTRSKVCIAYSLAEPLTAKMSHSWSTHPGPSAWTLRGGRAADALGPHPARANLRPAQRSRGSPSSSPRSKSSWSYWPKTSVLLRASLRRRA